VGSIDLSIIIVNYNTQKLTFECVNSIIKSKPKVNYEIIIVDNGSAEFIRDPKSKLKIIHNKVNLGFAKANNQGIRVAKGKHILLLNSDTYVEKGAIDNLYNFANITEDAGVVGAKLLNPDRSTQSSVFHFPSLKKTIRQYWLGEKGLQDKYALSNNSPQEVDAVVGAAFLITRQAIKKVGLLDERYFMYFEDLDYCRKVQEAGLKVYYLPNSTIIHLHGKSGGKMEYLVNSSKIYHGSLKYYLITLIIKTNQIFNKLFK
jgi:hypothetical protein